MGLALSTSWNALRHKDARAMLFEIKSLGFKEIELSFNLTPAMVSSIARHVTKEGLRVVSIHNYCPIPDRMKRAAALPDCYSMASLDEKERSLSIKFAKRTIDTAAKLGAKAVVLHCGRIEITDRTRALISLFERGLKNTRAFRRLKNIAVTEREKLSRPHLENALRSLEVLNKHAEMRRVSLGVETRYYYREIPSFEEIRLILKTFSGSRIFYWHDAGHAQVMQNLGLGSHSQYLKSYSDKMLGIHLHDLIKCRDHMAPGQGELNFKKIGFFLNKDTIKVIEAHYPASAEDLIASKSSLTEIYRNVI